MFDRRHFLTVTAGVTAAVAVNPLAAAARLGIDGAAPLPRLDRALDRATFAALRGERFRLRSAAGAVREARLVAVRDEGCCRQLEQFSVTFRTAPGVQLPEASYAVEHRTAGRCRLHLHPDAEGRQLTAVFSLLRPA